MAPLPKFSEVSSEFDTVQVSVKVIFGRPNIPGWISTQNGWMFSVNNSSGALYAVGGRSDLQVSNTNSPANLVASDLNFDASRVSSLYQKDLSEVRVNALFGLSLIRAYEV